ncbi:MAG: hypothetical protein M1294_04740 [Firmicutes bacterium]|jgi:hypothetical protein|uniref:Uncharacterized protein n=1 Tax=Sulfobacillus benefaciens TaxID=453960 RepID=A0A2T2X703_9FIRM|nr:hypothetical protein [Bacillota bacterium]MCL5013784.1 hypothetical protein [Bacillota bacterium]PSR30255.1 MAG: hypothetical protein C7B43_07035 [Sulfobacillus benefaciens]HBQ94718.1 hypothetical protein [Sulfobacillus sp.]
MELDNTQLERYARQVLVEEIGYDGQVQLLEHEVSIQGPPMWMHLAGRYLQAAGVRVCYKTEEPVSQNIRIHVDTGQMDDIQIPVDSRADSGQTVVNIGLALSQLLLSLAHTEAVW